MNLRDLLDLDITASFDTDDGLLLDTPKGVLTDDLIERIRQSKPGLIAELQGAREVGEHGELHRRCINPQGKRIDPGGEVHHAWLFHFADDREPVEVWFSPAADHDEVLAAYSDAVAAEPVSERITRTANVIERDELLALVQAIYADDTDQDRHDAIGLAMADPEGALRCYRAIAAVRNITVRSPVRTEMVSTEMVSKLVSTEPAPARACKSCRHLTRPGKADGYCAERADLPPAYGVNHPLRKLPDDQGADCASYAVFE